MTFPCIVHLDLKGAPWRIEYLSKVISFMKVNGAWGVLIEWEDTFPYTSELVDIGTLGGSSRDGMYSHDDVKHILQCIKENGMEPIQLVQTIGHMEFVLKHAQYSHLREVANSSAVLCPSRSGSLPLVEAIVRQVMDAQPDAAYLHIGADEAWHMNSCPDCRQRSQVHPHGAIALYLDHIKAVSSFIREKYPNVHVLMWDDMMRRVPVDVLKAYNLGTLVQPVMWDYNVKEHFNLDPGMWERYSQVFPKIWAASAFKGANGSCQMMCSVQRYASNQVAWHQEMKKLMGKITFSGIILTGWSRFDHYATLCELLPTALPSLASCLRMWTQPDGFTNESVLSESLPLASWWGHEASSALQAALEARTRALAFLHGDQVTTWLNPWQIEHEYTSPIQAESIAHNAKRLLSELDWIRRTLSNALHSLTGRRSSEEILQTWITPVERPLAELAATAAARAHACPGVTPRTIAINEVENL